MIGHSTNLLNEIDIEKTPKKRKVPTPSIETKRSNKMLQNIDTDSNLDSATKIRYSTRKNRLTKTV